MTKNQQKMKKRLLLEFRSIENCYSGSPNPHFEFGKKRNNELLTNKEEQKKFNDKLKKNYKKNIKYLKIKY